jgi:hypothetical protein
VGTISAEELARSVVEATPAMNQCYAKGLERNANLEGRMAVKLQIDPTGKVTTAGLADTKVTDKDTVKCIIEALREMHAPKNPGPLVSVLLPLELSTLTTSSATPGALTAPGSMDPTRPLPSAAPK